MLKSLPRAAAVLPGVRPLTFTYATVRMSSSDAPARRERRFAPLKPGADDGTQPKLEGIVFDVDGTLCKPQTYMFAEMRSALQIDKSTDILEHVYSLPRDQQAPAMQKIRAIEAKAMLSQEAQPGLTELMSYLKERMVRRGICTRNFDEPVTHLLDTFLGGLREFGGGPVVTRAFRPPKPEPAGIRWIAWCWGLRIRGDGAESGGGNSGGEDEDGLRVLRRGMSEEEEGEVLEHYQRLYEDAVNQKDGEGKEKWRKGDASRLIMVGDSIDDMTAGRRAGCATLLLVNDVNRHLAEHDDTDLVVERLDDLIGVLEDGFVSRP